MRRYWMVLFLLTAPLWILTLSYVSEPLQLPVLGYPFSLLAGVVMLPSPRGWNSLPYMAFVVVCYGAILVWGVRRVLHFAASVSRSGATVLGFVALALLIAPLVAQQWAQGMLRQRAIAREHAIKQTIRHENDGLSVTVLHRQFVPTPREDYTAFRYTIVVNGPLSPAYTYAIGNRLCAHACGEITGPPHPPLYHQTKKYAVSVKLMYDRETRQWKPWVLPDTDSMFFVDGANEAETPYVYVLPESMAQRDGRLAFDIQIPFHTENAGQVEAHSIEVSATRNEWVGQTTDSAQLVRATWTTDGSSVTP